MLGTYLIGAPLWATVVLGAGVGWLAWPSKPEWKANLTFLACVAIGFGAAGSLAAMGLLQRWWLLAACAAAATVAALITVEFAPDLAADYRKARSRAARAESESRIEKWADGLAERGAWGDLVRAVTNRTESYERRRAAGHTLHTKAGPETVDLLISELSAGLKQPTGTGLEDLTVALLARNDPRAIPVLADAFVARVVLSQWQGSLAEALGRSKHPAAVAALVRMLEHEDWQTRSLAALGLGLASVDDTRPALTKALDADPEGIRKALLRAHTDWASTVVKEWSLGFEKAMPDLAGMPVSEMVDILRQLCHAWTTQSAAQHSDKVLAAKASADMRRLEPIARWIGEELSRRGGIDEMRRVFSLVGSRPGARTLDMFWSGIGSWQG